MMAELRRNWFKIVFAEMLTSVIFIETPCPMSRHCQCHVSLSCVWF